MAEADALSFWGRLMPARYRWLAEHVENGLPDLAETQVLPTQLGLHHWSIGHGYLNLWSDMLKGHFSVEAMPEFKPAIRAIDDFCGKQMLMQDFADGGVHRSFLFGSQDASLGCRFERRFRSMIRPSTVSGPSGTYGPSGTQSMQAVLREIHNLAITCKPVVTRTNP